MKGRIFVCVCNEQHVTFGINMCGIEGRMVHPEVLRVAWMCAVMTTAH